MGKEKFDRVFKHYDGFIDLFNLNKMAEIRDLLDLKGHEVVLDLGGGTGRLADYISGDCQMVYVLDESRGMLSKVKSNPRIRPMHGDGLKTGFDDKSLDIVIMSDLVHHIKDQNNLIKEAHRILKDKGKIILLDFEKEHIRIRLLRAFERILFGKLYFKSGKEMKNLLSERFSITKFIHRGYYFIIRGEKYV